MTTDERKQMIQDYAKKVIMYPKGSKGYDPIDLMNLEYSIKKHLEVMKDKVCKCNPPTEIVPRYKFCSVCSCQITI